MGAISSGRQRCWLIGFIGTVLISGTSLAQISDPVTEAQAPVPGAGHHYTGMEPETVNPADGTPSFDLPLRKTG
jgi:hypothetical protein